MGIRGMGNLTGNTQGAVVHVTDRNHQWVSEMTGLTVEEVERRYEQAVDDNIVCTITIQPDHC